MSDDLASPGRARPDFSSAVRSGLDAVAAYEERLLKGARLKDRLAPESPGDRRFHVRVEDLLEESGRRAGGHPSARQIDKAPT
jgi:hypothetical protein